MPACFSPLRAISLTALLITTLLGLSSCASSDEQAETSTPWTNVQAPESSSAMASILPQTR